MKLDDYRLLGRSGLRVSPLCLGAMTFGTDWGWGSDETESRRIFDAYVDRGGNFIDTASVYTNGTSERFVGAFAKEKRNRLVIATKFTCASVKGDPNSGGNQRKNMLQTVEQSLKRMALDSIDLLYLHAWDGTTPGEEVMRAFDDLVSAGKVHYVGISDTPAWQVARMQTLADLRGWAPFVALQVEYSLVQRTVERDLLPMARELGLGVTPWSPLASGVLTGKYSARDLEHQAQASAQGTRRNIAAGNGSLTERSLGIAETVKAVAAELGCLPGQVAIAWTLQHEAVTAPILGARTVEQLEQNLGSLDTTLSAEHLKRLSDVSAIELGFPHDFLQLPLTREVILGGASIRPRSS
jgi:aryl-alcohol dehydrogenase-like predicted oxidoreductase